jgi:threonine/homoserine/homoserine lactone efflux protein
VGVSGLNPKGLLIFVALLPQFANPHGTLPLAVQLAVLGLVFMVTVGVFYLILGSLTRTVLIARPAVARTVSRISGVGMFLIGAFLLIDRLL